MASTGSKRLGRLTWRFNRTNSLFTGHQPIWCRHAGVEATFRRFQAARQLAWLVRRLAAPAAGIALPAVLPLLLAIMEDVSPAVQRTGAFFFWSNLRVEC